MKRVNRWGFSFLLALGWTVPVIAADPLDTWTAVPASPDHATSIACGAGVCVVTTWDGAIYSSTNCTTWILQKPPEPFVSEIALQKVAFLDGKFYAVGRDRILSSANGSDWTSQSTANTSDRLYGIGFYFNQLFAVGNTSSGTALLLVSTNGENWVRKTIPGTAGLRAVAGGNRKVVAIGYNQIAESLDGAVWRNATFILPRTRYPLPPPGSDLTFYPKENANLQSLIYHDGMFYAFGTGEHNDANGMQSRLVVMASRFGIDWAEKALGSEFNLSTNFMQTLGFVPDVTQGAGMLVAAGSYQAKRTSSLWQHGGTFLLTSRDGIVWSRRDQALALAPNSIVFRDGFFFLAGGSNLFRSGYFPSPDPPKFLLSGIKRYPNGSLDLMMQAPSLNRLIVEGSTDLISWTTVKEITNSSGIVELHIDGELLPARFYRFRGSLP